jgi:hypothetical protein
MDDSRIDEIRRDVLSRLAGAGGEGVPSAVESRLAALEVSVARLERVLGHPAGPSAPGHAHPSLVVLSVPAGSDRCVMEPDKPCIHSGACRTFGH